MEHGVGLAAARLAVDDERPALCVQQTHRQAQPAVRVDLYEIGEPPGHGAFQNNRLTPVNIRFQPLGNLKSVNSPTNQNGTIGEGPTAEQEGEHIWNDAKHRIENTSTKFQHLNVFFGVRAPFTLV